MKKRYKRIYNSAEIECKLNGKTKWTTNIYYYSDNKPTMTVKATAWRFNFLFFTLKLLQLLSYI